MVWPSHKNHENLYPTNNSTFTIFKILHFISPVHIYLQALLEWEPPSFHKELQIKGFQIYVDNKTLGGVRSKDTRQMLINNMVAGKNYLPFILVDIFGVIPLFQVYFLC